MDFFVGPARAGLIVVTCLLAACSGTADPERTPSSGAPPSAPSSATSPAPSDPAPAAPSTTSASTPSASTSGGEPSSGEAVCEPDASCHGINTCDNYCYGKDCCTARCGCNESTDRLRCDLSCNPSPH